MSINNIPELFFNKEIHTLTFSEESLKLKDIKTNIWIFELIALYQTLEFISKQSLQRWSFTKEGHAVLVKCYNIHGDLIQALFADIGHHLNTFKEITFYVIENKCMVEAEYGILMSKPGNQSGST